MATTLERTTTAVRTKPAIIDCDIHNELDSEQDLYPFLPQRWLQHIKTFGRRGYSGANYPRFLNRRNDAWPPSGRQAGADCDFMIHQLLDEWNIVYGVLNPLTGVGSQLNPEFDAALATAVNDWQVAEWLEKDARLRASIIVPFEHADLAVAEIKRRASDKRFVQVQFSGRPREPMGRRKYWPIYEACAENDLAVMSHAFGSGGQPITGCGWPSFYIEDHVGPAQAMQANLISLVVEGVFERFPTLRVVSAENGFGWAASLMWRLDNTYRLLRAEVPHLKRLPSEYLREHVWYCTQPIEEPHKPVYFKQVLEQIGADRLIFASDYAHWDWDAPDTAFPIRLPDDTRRQIFYDNARRLYRLPDVASEGTV
ncbi:MAG: amidohydrolase family protein [Thermomicrobiales bacterium]